MPDYAHIIGDRVFFYLARSSGVSWRTAASKVFSIDAERAGVYEISAKRRLQA